MQVPFLSLKDITAKYADELHEAVIRVTDSGWYLQGNENKRFEEDYAKYIGTKYCVCCERTSGFGADDSCLQDSERLERRG